MKTRNKKSLGARTAAALAALLVSPLWADNQWKSPPSADTVYVYEDGDNWSMGIPACTTEAGGPSAYRCAAFNSLSADAAAGTTRIKFTDNQELSTFRSFQSAKEGAPIAWDFDLNGKTVTAIYTGESVFMNGGNTCISQDDLGPSGSTMIIRNGTLDMKGSLAFGRADLAPGGFTVSAGAVLKGKMGSYFGSPRLKIEAGGTFTCSSGFAQGDANAESAKELYGYICVTGENAVATFAGDAALGGRRMRLYVLDGGSFTASSLTVGANGRSDDTRLIVDGGRLSVTVWGLGLGSNNDGCRNPRIVLGADPRTLVSVPYVSVVQGRNACLEWRVPRDGWTDGQGTARAPLQCVTGGNSESSGQFLVKPLADGLTDEGGLKAAVRARDWMIAHPGETIDLLQAQKDSREALAAVCAAAVVEDFNPEEFEDEPVFSVSDDGRALRLTAPKTVRPAPPKLTISAQAGAEADGKRTLKVQVTDVGFCASSIRSLTLACATAADYSGAETTTLAVPSGAAAFPQEWTFEGALPAHDAAMTWFCKVTAENDKGKSASCEIIEDAGVAEYFRWTQAADGDFYDLARWEMGTDGKTWGAATHFPRGEDIVKMPDAYGAFTVTSDHDVEIKAIQTWMAGATEAERHHATFDLRGHKFTLTGKVADDQNDMITMWGRKSQVADLSLPTANYTFKNAQVENRKLWFTQGSIGGIQSGGLAFTDGSSVIYQCLGFNNGSTLRVESGATLAMTNANVQFTTSRSRQEGCGYVLVKDAGSSLVATNANFRFGLSGRSTGLHVLDGALMSVYSLVIGWGDASYSGAPSAATENNNCFAVVSNATLKAAQLRLGYPAEVVDSPKLTIAGESAHVDVLDTFYNYQDTGAELVFDIPADGWRQEATGSWRAPLTAQKFASVARKAEQTRRAATRLRVRYKAARDALGGQTIPLMTLATPNGDALRELAATDPRGRVSVSEDGRTLLMAVPTRGGTLMILR